MNPAAAIAQQQPARRHRIEFAERIDTVLQGHGDQGNMPQAERRKRPQASRPKKV
jgi:hypothetical protein